MFTGEQRDGDEMKWILITRSLAKANVSQTYIHDMDAEYGFSSAASTSA
jgi:hypothetical protein